MSGVLFLASEGKTKKTSDRKLACTCSLCTTLQVRACQCLDFRLCCSILPLNFCPHNVLVVSYSLEQLRLTSPLVTACMTIETVII